MLLRHKHLILLMAFLAVVCVQGYGAGQGYATHHGISVSAWTGDSGAPQDGGTSDSGDHAPITIDMDVGHGGISALHLEFCPVQLAEICVRDWILWQHLAEVELLDKAQSDTSGTVARLTTVQMMRCVVMLI